MVHLKLNPKAIGYFADRAVRNEDARRKDPKRKCDDFLWSEYLEPFEIDEAKIVGSKALRRLGLKTQVVTSPGNPHVRTRLTHTLEVKSFVVKPARILGLNHVLCSASALGHDIGHTPFGHAGESFLKKMTGKNFRHNIFSVVVAQQIERTGSGLRLTHQTLSGMKNHSRGAGDVVSDLNVALEDNLLMIGDKVEYTWSDINDIFFRLKLLDIADYPELQILMNWFGNNQRERVNTCIIGLCNESVEKNTISFTDSEAGSRFNCIKRFMYEREIYEKSNFKGAEDRLEKVYDFLYGNPLLGTVDPAVALALMTDNDVFSLCEKDSLKENDLLGSSVWEIVPKLQGKEIDFLDSNLDW